MPSWPDRASARFGELAAAGQNVARLPLAAITADLSTDSGRRHPPDGAAHELGPNPDPDLDAVVSLAFGVNRWLATGSGRGAEAVVAAALIEPGARILANEVYVSGRWWIERLGGRIDELPADLSPARAGSGATSRYEDVAYVQLTLPRAVLGPTAGNPVPLDKVVEVRRWIDRCLPHAPLVVDASRLWENAAACHEAASEVAALADVVMLSTRKDIGADRGGLVVNRSEVFWDRLVDAYDIFEGPGGGLDQGDLVEIGDGLRQMSAGAAVARYGELRAHALSLRRAGLPKLSYGCGSIFLDAGEWLPQVHRDELPAQALLNVIYLMTGWRGLGTSTDEGDSAPTVRLAVRGSAAELHRRLPAVAQVASQLRSGLRPLPRDRAAPYLQPASPTDPSDWPSPAQAVITDAPSPGLARWLVGHTPHGLGPQRAVAEALSYCATGAAAAAADPTLARLHERLARSDRTPHIAGAAAVARIDAPTNWAEIAEVQGADLVWTSNADSGMVAVRAGSPFADLVDRASLFTLGTWLTPS